MYNKFILKLTDREIEKELSDILGKTIKKPLKWTGNITNNPGEYYNDGKINEKELIGLYDKEDMEEMFITLSFTSLRSRPKDLFNLIKSQKKGNKVLEYGHGTSTHGIACAQKGCEVWGVDVSTYMKEKSIERYNSRGVSANLITDKTPLPDGYFDTILCTDVFEHVPDPLALLRKLMKCLKKGAMVHLNVSSMVNYKKGHLAQSIHSWKNPCQRVMKKNFVKISKNNYRYKGNE